jgi:hypothetical protein
MGENSPNLVTLVPSQNVACIKDSPRSFLEKILANKNKKALVALSLATRFVGVVSAY